MDFASLPSNVRVDVISYVANDRDISWPDLLRFRKTSRTFAAEILKQLKTAIIAEIDYSSELRKPCYEANNAKVISLTSGFFAFLSKISDALTEIYFPRSVVHNAALANLSITGTLKNIDCIHLVVCSADCFTFIDSVSQITPTVNALIIEYPRFDSDKPCSKCVPHQLGQLWDVVHWNPTQLQKLALLGFYPSRRYGCCAARPRGIILDPRIYNCTNLIALNLRRMGLRHVSVLSFPLLRELRLGLYADNNPIGNSVMREVAALNLEFLDLGADSDILELDDLFSINQLQFLPRLTHLHLDLRGCDDVAFAAFFRRPQIQLQKVTIFICDDELSLISDVIEGNPGLQVLAVDADFDAALDMNDNFDALPGLSDLKSLAVSIHYHYSTNPGKPQSPTFFRLLDPIVHSKLQVVALVCDLEPRDVYTGIIEQVQRRFAGHHVNGRPVEILGASKWDNIHNRITQNYPDCACCVEPLVLAFGRYKDFRFQFTADWKSIYITI